MIVRRGIVVDVNGEPQLFDYAGCVYPEGDDPQNTFYFNEENIDKVLFNGFSDEENDRYESLYQKWRTENPIPKVNVAKMKKKIEASKSEEEKTNDALFNNHK